MADSPNPRIAFFGPDGKAYKDPPEIPWGGGEVSIKVGLEPHPVELQSGTITLRSSAYYEKMGPSTLELIPSSSAPGVSEAVSFRVSVNRLKVGGIKDPRVAGVLPLSFEGSLVAEDTPSKLKQRLQLFVLSPFADFGKDWHQAVSDVEPEEGAVSEACQHPPSSIICPRPDRENRLEEAIGDQKSNIVWFHGVPGIGKTFLLTRLMESAKIRGHTPIYLRVPSDATWRRWQLLWKLREANPHLTTIKPDLQYAWKCRYRFSLSSRPFVGDLAGSKERPFVLIVDGIYHAGTGVKDLFESIIALWTSIKEDYPEDYTKVAKLLVTDVLPFEERVNRLGYEADVTRWLNEEIRPVLRSLRAKFLDDKETRDIVLYPFLPGSLPRYAAYHIDTSKIGRLCADTAGHPTLIVSSLNKARQLYTRGVRQLSLRLDKGPVSDLLNRYRKVGLLSAEEKLCLDQMLSGFSWQTQGDWRTTGEMSLGDKHDLALTSLHDKGIVQTKVNGFVMLYRITPAFVDSCREIKKLCTD